VLVEGRSLRTDSGGAGKYRGGLGIDMRVRNLVEGKWNFELVRRSQCPPWGLWGGAPGDHGTYLLREPKEREFRAMGGAHHPVPIDAEVIVRTGGGGGWGDPLERDPQAVRIDVQEEFISARAAQENYGVVLRDDRSIDQAATAQLRAALRARRGSEQGNAE
jgi:N-methylhydantoinase B